MDTPLNNPDDALASESDKAQTASQKKKQSKLNKELLKASRLLADAAVAEGKANFAECRKNLLSADRLILNLYFQALNEPAKIEPAVIGAVQNISTTDAETSFAAYSAEPTDFTNPLSKGVEVQQYILDRALATLGLFPSDSGQYGQKSRKRIRAIESLVSKLKNLIGPPQPQFVFDPAEFRITAHLIATAMLAQPLRPLSDSPEEVGSGVYALFYVGNLAYYGTLRGMNHPIYVGSAQPKAPYASTAEAQGMSLSRRLADHMQSVQEVEKNGGNLKLADFKYRYICVRSGWELAAENYLINQFRPVWNVVCTGLGKHGDSSTTRANLRSLWDTLHKGREWALTAETKPNKKTVSEIEEVVKKHLTKYPPKELSVSDILGFPAQLPTEVISNEDAADAVTESEFAEDL